MPVFHRENFARIWIHTHPGNSPEPSLMDLRTFATSFGQCDWSVMMILAEDDSTFARLQFRTGPVGSIDLKTASPSINPLMDPIKTPGFKSTSS